MQIKNSLLVLIFLAVNVTARANVKIFGSDTTYANEKIILLKQQDGITKHEIVIDTIFVNGDGSFNVEFESNSTFPLIMYLGVYKAVLYTEPGMEYDLVLPPRKDKTTADVLNPYFKYEEVRLAIKNFDDKELNTQIQMFEDAFIPYVNTHVDKVFKSDDFFRLDEEIESLEKKYRRSDNVFFNNYRKYRYGYLRFLALQHKSQQIAIDYYKNQPILWNNPAYWALFEKLFNGYFMHVVSNESGKKLGTYIKSVALDSIRYSIDKAGLGNDIEFQDLVILYNLSQEFYDDNFSRNHLLEVLKVMKLGSATSRTTTVANQMYNKVTQLLAGYEPPKWELYDSDSNLVQLSDYSGKHVYLNFCMCYSYSCLNEFVQLQKLYEKHKQYLEVVTIIADDDVQIMKSFLQRSGYSWTFLHYGNTPSVITDYDIRAFPTYYLIDTEGKMVMSPAPTPNEQFEGRLFKVLRAAGVL